MPERSLSDLAPARLFDLSGSVAIVTGGSSGIGLAATRTLAAAGSRIAIIDRSPPEGAILAELGAGAAQWLEADVSREEDVRRVVDKVVEHFGGIDVLVNNAGLAIRDAAVDLPLEAWEKVVAVNMTGAFLMARTVAARMIAGSRGGAIVNTSSIMGLSGGGLYPNVSYQTTKGAVVNMTRALAVEWAPHRIRVNAVAPTYVRTPFIAPLLAKPELVRRIEDMTPLRRLAEPEEVAAAILFLASPAAAMITGHTLPVDGGFLAQ